MELAYFARSIAVLIPVLVSALLAVLKLFEHRSNVARSLGYGAVVLLALYSTGEVWSAFENSLERARSSRGVSRYVPVEVSGKVLAEASGGTFVGSEGAGGRGQALVVDDERSFIYRLDFDPATRDYVSSVAFEVKAPDGDDLDDLEAVAYHEGAVYLMTSHSNAKDGHRKKDREWLVKIDLPAGGGPPVVTAAVGGLRDSIEAVLEGFGLKDWKNKDGKVEGMNVEGLAIDAAGIAYVGLRSPLVGGKALMLKAPLNSLFGQSMEWTPVLLELAHADQDSPDPAGYRRHVGQIHHGITSLEYDVHSDRIFVLSNAEHREDWYKPVLWSFRVSEAQDGTIRPRKCDAGDSDVTNAGKPEAVLVHPVVNGSILERLMGWIRRGQNGQVSIFYDVADRPSLFRVLDRYDLCREIRYRPEARASLRP